MKKQKKTKAWETLKHEMVHASLAIGGISDVLNSKTEEAIVRNFDSILLPALDLNRKKKKR